jgi:simple sugar transport system substrate-binding protein
MIEKNKAIQLVGALLLGLIIGAGVTYVSMQAIGPLGPGGNRMNAGFIYVGPVGDIGWTHAHDQARQYLENKFDWLDTSYAESVPESETASYVDNFIAQGSDIVFTTSFGFMDPTLQAAQNNPDTMFFHCSGYKRSDNMGTYFAEFYQIYYLNGMMAGALTETNQIGYVAGFLIPEVVRHLNAFLLGARAVNPNVELHVRELEAWYDPSDARAAAQDLVQTDNVDVLAFTEDSSAIVQYAQEEYDEGNPIYAFGHYSPMAEFGPDVAVSGQLVRWEVIYEDILSKAYSGAYNTTNLENVDYWWMLQEGAVELGANFSHPINPKFETPLKAESATHPITGNSVNIYDLVLNLKDMMATENVLFDPYTGPIYYQNGSLWLSEGVRATHDQLWSMDFYLKGVSSGAPSI